MVFAITAIRYNQEKTITEIREHRDSNKQKMEDEANGIIGEIKSTSIGATKSMERLRKESDLFSNRINEEFNKMKFRFPEDLEVQIVLSFKLIRESNISSSVRKYFPNAKAISLFPSSMTNSKEGFKEIKSSLISKLGSIILMLYIESKDPAKQDTSSKNGGIRGKIIGAMHTGNIQLINNDETILQSLSYNLELETFTLVTKHIPINLVKYLEYSSLLDFDKCVVNIMDILAQNNTEIIYNKDTQISISSKNSPVAEIKNIKKDIGQYKGKFKVAKEENY